jgi:hypothetical protein
VLNSLDAGQVSTWNFMNPIVKHRITYKQEFQELKTAKYSRAPYAMALVSLTDRQIDTQLLIPLAGSS